MSQMHERVKNLDACIKCSACTAHCPVASVYPFFPGPKLAGPDAERLRLEGVEIDAGYLDYCSNCKTCETTCPSGVKITSMIIRARQKCLNPHKTILQKQVRGLVLGRAEYLGRLGTIWPGLLNSVTGLPLARKLLERLLGISSQAPLPAYRRKFKGSKRKSTGEGLGGPFTARAVYFPGCFITYNDPLTGQAAVKVLEHNGYEVIVPPFQCCGVPLQANGFFREARNNALRNLALLEPYLKSKVPVITGCPSCSLALKEEYPNLNAAGAESIGQHVYDLFEFLWELYERNELRKDFQEVPASLGYHAPCHLKTQGIGMPSVRLLRLIPGVRVNDLDVGCCGLAGSFGFKQEKYDLAMKIGNPLFNRIQLSVSEGKMESMTTECGGCQIQIQHGSRVKTKHPIWVVLQAYGLEI